MEVTMKNVLKMVMALGLVSSQVFALSGIKAPVVEVVAPVVAEETQVAAGVASKLGAKFKALGAWLKNNKKKVAALGLTVAGTALAYKNPILGHKVFGKQFGATELTFRQACHNAFTKVKGDKAVNFVFGQEAKEEGIAGEASHKAATTFNKAGRAVKYLANTRVGNKIASLWNRNATEAKKS